MFENMKLAPEIIGYWVRESPAVNGELEYLLVDSEGRIILEVPDAQRPGRILPMRLWCRLEAQSSTSYEVSGKPSFTPYRWHVSMGVDSDRLIIGGVEGKISEFNRTSQEDIPPRFQEFVSESLSTMEERERNGNS